MNYQVNKDDLEGFFPSTIIASSKGKRMTLELTTFEPLISHFKVVRGGTTYYIGSNLDDAISCFNSL